MLTPIVSDMVRFAKAVYFNSYRLKNRSQRYGKQKTGLVNQDKKRMYQWTRRDIFEGRDPIAMITFLCKFVRSCSSINVHEGVAVWLLPN